jgi:hypothetical protein
MKRIFYSLFGCDAGGLKRKCDDCPDDEPNRIIHVAFVNKGATVNETPEGLITSLLALEASCDAFIVRNVNGTMAQPTYQTGKGAGKQLSRTLSGSHSVTITDFDMIENIENFWNRAISNAQNLYMYFFTDSRAWVVRKPLNISPGAPITDDYNTFIEGSVNIVWSSKFLPVTIKVGANGVDRLEQCPVLFENEEGFVNNSGSMASISEDGLSITIDSGDSLTASLSSNGVVLDSVTVSDGELPTGISVSIASNGTSIDLTGLTTNTGTYNAVIRAENACGVAAEFTIKIIVK